MNSASGHRGLSETVNYMVVPINYIAKLLRYATKFVYYFGEAVYICLIFIKRRIKTILYVLSAMGLQNFEFWPRYRYGNNCQL